MHGFVCACSEHGDIYGYLGCVRWFYGLRDTNETKLTVFPLLTVVSSMKKMYVFCKLSYQIHVLIEIIMYSLSETVYEALLM